MFINIIRLLLIVDNLFLKNIKNQFRNKNGRLKVIKN